jgi:hypothetical protein
MGREQSERHSAAIRAGNAANCRKSELIAGSKKPALAPTESGLYQRYRGIMPHNRKIRPEFFMCDALAETSVPARLMMLALSMIDDSKGVIRKDAEYIKIFAFSRDDVDVEGLIDELVFVGAVIRVEAGLQFVDPDRWFCPHKRGDNLEAQTHWAAVRRARKRQAMPAWADKERIKKVYKRARQLSQASGEPYHVDHILPLCSDIVCGLHVHENLQVIPARENIIKSNTVEVSS